MKKKTSLFSPIVFAGTAIFLAAVSLELYTIAWGTGNWLGEFSLKWGLGFVLSIVFFGFLLSVIWLFLWRRGALQSSFKYIIAFRQKLNFFRWIIALLLLFFPIYFFQYTLWGLVFTGVYFRLFTWAALIIFLAILLTQEEDNLISWPALLASILLSGAIFTLASVFSNVTDYPFNLYWSDGNRLWDYSLMFGRRLYNYPADQAIPSLTSKGRQILWGLPFLLPNTTIFIHRFWSALVLSLPYAILGWVAFKAEQGRKKEWLLIGLWAFLFLNQGPIYTPLVLSAILVAFAWKRPLWVAIPLVAFAGYYAEATRWTWEFAPAIWAGMLALNGSQLKGARLTPRQWGRAIILTLSGIATWFLVGTIANIPTWILAGLLILLSLVILLIPLARKKRWQPSLWQKKAIYGILFVLLIVGLILSDGFSAIIKIVTGIVASVQSSVSTQTLLWYRLFPSDTYPEGILLGLIIAILPLAILLIHLARKKYWQPSLWQKLAMLVPLLAFLVAGLVISAKIGGGNNLHNLDMFLITLLFVAAIAWKNGGSQWFAQTENSLTGIKITLLLLLILPAFPSLRGIRPRLSLTPAQVVQIETLTDFASVSTDPPDEEIEEALAFIYSQVEQAERQGEILFIDQRQLLTFGYVPKVPLVPEYEKKRMMNEAMTGNPAYFAPYYQNLADHRFSLIITEPLKTAYKGEEVGIFAEESDAWTKWVAAPTLCFYEPLATFKSVYVQLLIPRKDAPDCSVYLQ